MDAPAQYFVWEDYIILPKTQPTWLVEPIIPVGGIACLYGKPKKARKSNAAIDMCLSLADHTEEKPTHWLGFPVKQAARSLYLQLDVSRSLWNDRCVKLYEAGVEFPKKMCYVADRESAPHPFNILDVKHAAWLKRVVAEVEPALIVVDTFREMFRGDENDSDKQQTAISFLRDVCRPAAILLISHSKKQTKDSEGHELDVMDEGRGSTYLPGAVDTMMRIKGFRDKTGILTVHGRALDMTQVKLVANDLHFWETEAVADPFRKALQGILEDAEFSSDAERAKALAALSGKSFAACKMAISRLRKP